MKLDILKLQERYSGANHWKYLDNLVHGKIKPRGRRYYLPIEETEHNLEYIRYLKQVRNRRVELNSIMNEMGADGPRLFWNWLRKKIIETFPLRNYNRAITVPGFVLTPTMTQFQSKLQESLTSTLQTTVDELELELDDTEGLLVTRQKLLEIRQTMVDALLEEPGIKRIDSTLQKLMNRL